MPAGAHAQVGEKGQGVAQRDAGHARRDVRVAVGLLQQEQERPLRPLDFRERRRIGQCPGGLARDDRFPRRQPQGLPQHL